NNTQNNASQQNNANAGNATAQNNSQNKNDEDKNKNHRRRTNLVIEDSRDLPNDNEEVDDGRIQNKNIVIDLQPIFIISAFEKNAVDYDRFQYYNLALDELNEMNNYNPILTISNKPLDKYMDVFENFILFFNAKIKIQESSNNYLNRGIFYSLTGNYNKALEDLNKTIKMDDKQGIAYFTRANCRYKMLEQMEMLPGSEDKMTIPIKNNSVDESEGKTKASIDYQQILDDYELTLFRNPKFFFGYFNRAYIKLRLGEYKSAVEDLNRAIELEPEFAEAYFNRGLTKIYLDDIEGGALDLSRAGELGIVGAYNIIKRYCN
ncbi:MAG TPA: tetratricopeptide repeat protein, partial [Draconibacterium sp.]|nr:tetratricopeptide repeat protein [Draconibacterium sp.]